MSDIWHGPPFPVEARQPGPDPQRTSYRSFNACDLSMMRFMREMSTELKAATKAKARAAAA